MVCGVCVWVCATCSFGVTLWCHTLRSHLGHTCVTGIGSHTFWITLLGHTLASVTSVMVWPMWLGFSVDTHTHTNTPEASPWLFHSYSSFEFLRLDKEKEHVWGVVLFCENKIHDNEILWRKTMIMYHTQTKWSKMQTSTNEQMACE